MDITEIISSIKRPERMVPLCLRGDLQSEWDRLEEAFNIADTTISGDVLETGRSAEAARLAQEMELVRHQMMATTVRFTLRALGRKDWKKIAADNPPSDDDLSGLDVDEEQFVTDMIAACCIEPTMTRSQAETLRDELTDGQWQSLATAAWELNKNTLVVPFSLAAQTSAALSVATFDE